METPDEGRRVEMGEPLDWSDEDLDRMAEVTPDDALEAQQRWREWAPDRLETEDGTVYPRELLDADTDETES